MLSGFRAHPDSLAREAVEPLLRGAFGRPYQYERRCDSTQNLLRRNLPEGAVAVCDIQTGGRGRLGRTWSAPLGTSILCSVLLRPATERRPSQAALLGGLAVAEAVEHATERFAHIKWPNDVLVESAKVAGVLAELVDETVILGIGLNVNQHAHELPSTGRTPAASLFTVDSIRRSRAPLLADLLVRLEHHYRRWQTGGLDSIHPDLEVRDCLRGRPVRVAGELVTAVGIDPGGGLRIEHRGETRVIESGEVELADREADLT